MMFRSPSDELLMPEGLEETLGTTTHFYGGTLTKDTPLVLINDATLTRLRFSGALIDEPVLAKSNIMVLGVAKLQPHQRRIMRLN